MVEERNDAEFRWQIIPETECSYGYGSAGLAYCE